MKYCIIGSGGREHALCSSLKNSNNISKIYCIPGNAGTSLIAENRSINLKDFEQIKKICNRTDNPVWMNKSNTEPYQSFYNERTINRVGEIFEKDIKRFNYSY